VGETGEIVLTHLDAYGMPLIRYRTGDRARLLPGRCACGRGLPLMDVVQGRMTDVLYLPNGTAKHGLAVIYPLRETPGLRQFRVLQHEDYSVTVEVVLADKNADLTNVLAGKLRPVLEHAVPLDVRSVDAIPLTRTGKFRHVVSQAAPRCPTQNEGVPV
jgi:phenylacetate-CoA ligase